MQFLHLSIVDVDHKPLIYHPYRSFRLISLSRYHASFKAAVLANGVESVKHVHNNMRESPRYDSTGLTLSHWPYSWLTMFCVRKHKQMYVSGCFPYHTFQNQSLYDWANSQCGQNSLKKQVDNVKLCQTGFIMTLVIFLSLNLSYLLRQSSSCRLSANSA